MEGERTHYRIIHYIILKEKVIDSKIMQLSAAKVFNSSFLYQFNESFIYKLKKMLIS